MTHDELLAKILETGATALQSSTLGGGWIYDAKTNALRTVVELHKPYESTDMGLICTFCKDMGSVEHWYPCPTIEAIEKELA